MGGVNRLVYFCGYFVLLVLFALHVQETNGDKEVPVTRLGQNVGFPTLKVLYW